MSVIISLAAVTSAIAAQPLGAPPAATPLFSDETPLRLSLAGAILAVAHARPGTSPVRPARLTLSSPPEAHAVTLAPRGKSRRQDITCSFVPLSLRFPAPPPPSSLFAGQRRLKLVTHCRAPESFQQHLLLELAAYRMFNAMSPISYRVRLAQVDYRSEGERPLISRLAFFIEDVDDVARRNGLVAPRMPDRVPSASLDPRQAAKVALFQYMIGNLDWAVTAARSGEGCCHNVRLAFAPARAGVRFPIPFDFDYSGLVDAPYAVAPEGVGRGSDVRARVWRGHCRFNADVLAEAAALRARRGAIEGALSGVPGLTERSRTRALDYLGGFWRDIADDATVRAKLLSKCLG